MSNPITQLHIARHNKLATALGTCAGIVPIGVFSIGHNELRSWNPLVDGQAFIVYAGLVFSALTVVTWASDVFASIDAGRGARAAAVAKAIGFTALVEGMMMTSANRWLSGAALAMLVLINAVANGCRLAVRAAAHNATEAERAASKPSRRARPRLKAVA